MDLKEDAQHPVKKNRPLTSGDLTHVQAGILFFILLFLSSLISFTLLPKNFTVIVASYLFLNIAYSTALKHLAIVDIFCIATGFVLRVFAGGIAAQVYISKWIIIMSFLLSLFLALAKRRDDFMLKAPTVRKSLNSYNLEFISFSMVLMASVIIVSYILYTVSPDVVGKHKTSNLYLTAFWVIAGILRYMQVTFVENRSGSQTHLLLKDYFLQIVIASWVINCYLLLYY